MCEGEFESLKAIHAVSPSFVLEPYSWGKYTQDHPETYFLLAEFRDVGKQVRALRSAVLSRTHDIKSPRQLPFPAAHCTPIDVQKSLKCLSSKLKQFMLVSCQCFEANHQIAGKSYEARGWSSQSTQGIYISYWKIWLSPVYLPVTPRSLRRSTPGKTHRVFSIPDTSDM